MIPQVSWLIPLLNGMPYLPQALASLEAQTFKSFEVIVWDNGSIDGSVETLKQWIPSRLPGRIVTGEPHSLGNSLRRLVESAAAPLVARMDADDVCEAHRLETQVRYLGEHPETALVASDRVCLDEAGNEIAPRSSYPFEAHDLLHATLRAPRIVHPTVVMRRDCLLNAGNYRDLSSAQCPYWSEDYDLWLRFLSQYRAVALPEKLLRYRYNPAGLTESEMRLKRAAIARREAWRTNASAFAGISNADVAMRLWDKQLICALPVLNRIAQHFTKRDGIATMTRWRMPSFRNAAATFVRKEDLLTRIWLKMVARRAGA